MFAQNDLELLSSKGISIEQVEEQLSFFKKGFPYLSIVASASVEKGIMRISESEQLSYIDVWETYLKENKQILKFVPASGAASRMFKDLFEFLKADYDVPTTSFEKKFFEGIKNFAFYLQLNDVCLKNEQKDIDRLIVEGFYKAIVRNLLQSSGLNYGQLPKGLLEFHNYTEGPRTAIEEHLVEGALYSCNAAQKVNLHFTVSQEHHQLFQSLTTAKIPVYENKFNVKYNVSFSEQKSSTDTIAVDGNNQPFRENGQLLFRPGGHGALIENLNDVDADVVFIKNIDNVVPDSFKDITVQYKKLIAGVLACLQRKIFDYLDLIESGKYTRGNRHDWLRRAYTRKRKRDLGRAIYRN